jgi:ribonuclease HI
VEGDIEVIRPLPDHLSAQQADLLALTTACELGEGKAFTVYSDSAYAIGVCLSWCGIWKAREFTNTTGTPINNRPYVE